MMDLSEAMKRIEELEKEREGYRSSLVSMWNYDRSSSCGFCQGSGLCSSMKGQLRQSILQEWNRPLTWEEHIAWCENRAVEHEEWKRRNAEETANPDHSPNR